PGRRGRYKRLPSAFDSQAFVSRVQRLIGRVFENATYFRSRGVWRGGSEDGLVVEVIATPVRGSCTRLFERAEGVARNIARQLGQEAVLLVVTDSRGKIEQDVVTAA